MASLPDNRQDLDSTLFSALMEKSADAIFFKDLQSRYIRVSNRMTGIFGADHPSQVEGKTDSDYYSPEHAALTLADEQKVISTGFPVLDKEEREVWADGSVTWASTSKFPLRDAEGEVIGVFGISRDITARKEAENELALANTQLIETAKKAAVAEFAGGIIENVNSMVISLDTSLKLMTQDLKGGVKTPEQQEKLREELSEAIHVVRQLSALMRAQH